MLTKKSLAKIASAFFTVTFALVIAIAFATQKVQAQTALDTNATAPIPASISSAASSATLIAAEKKANSKIISPEHLPGVIRQGGKSCKAVALTFDLCPVLQKPGYDKVLVDYLITNKIPATFFISGKWMQSHKKEVQSLLAVAHFEIGTHGEKHEHLQSLGVAAQTAEILGPVHKLKKEYGRDAMFFRPPYGEFNEKSVQLATENGLKFVLWSVVSADPDPHFSAHQIEQHLEKSMHAGDVVVLHANGKGQHTAEVVKHLHEQMLPQKNLKPVLMSALLACP